MPATSKAQQAFMGMVHALQQGEISASSVSEKVRKAAASMSQKSAKDFASTKTKGLPQHVVMAAIKKRIKKKKGAA
jgi:hypothetical protein